MTVPGRDCNHCDRENTYHREKRTSKTTEQPKDAQYIFTCQQGFSYAYSLHCEIVQNHTEKLRQRKAIWEMNKHASPINAINTTVIQKGEKISLKRLFFWDKVRKIPVASMSSNRASTIHGRHTLPSTAARLSLLMSWLPRQTWCVRTSLVRLSPAGLLRERETNLCNTLLCVSLDRALVYAAWPRHAGSSRFKHREMS